jgi:sulfur-oxidizing protein SoxY
VNVKRRLLVRAGMSASLLALAGSAGLLIPRRAHAAWPKAAFDATTVEAALKEVVGAGAPTAGDIFLQVPELAENGAVVPVTVSTQMAKVESISVIAARNFNPLICSFEFGEGAEPYVETRIKMAESADVVAVVKADGKLYSVSKPVKVVIGGCG